MTEQVPETATGKGGGFRRSLAYQSLALGGFALAAAALLTIGDRATRDDIALRRAEDLKASLVQVVPAGMHDNDLLADVAEVAGRTIYRATRAGSVSAVAYEIRGVGYGGEIRLILGLDRTGRILGTRVLSHAETPGLGDRLDIARDAWITGFDGLSLAAVPESDWAVKKDGGRFDQFTGATVTPRAVVAAVKAGLDFFDAHKQSLFDMEAGG